MCALGTIAKPGSVLPRDRSRSNSLRCIANVYVLEGGDGESISQFLIAMPFRPLRSGY